LELPKIWMLLDLQAQRVRCGLR